MGQIAGTTPSEKPPGAGAKFVEAPRGLSELLTL